MAHPVAESHLDELGHAQCSRPRLNPGQASLPLVVGATGCTPQQAAADKVCQPGLGGIETDIQPDPGADEHAPRQPARRPPGRGRKSLPPRRKSTGAPAG